MKTCRICGSSLGNPVYTSSGISITSVRSICDTPLNVYMCPDCFHVQKPALQFAFDYYDKEYRISLESDDFDQLYDKINNKCIYRTDYQAELVLNSINIPSGAKILDYGAGKASTLKKISAIRKDLIPYVFDVSDNYKKTWQSFLPSEQQATYQIPKSWKNNFSLITCHFVLEHVEDPCSFFNNIAELLVDDGFVFFTIPNLLTNPGDLIAVDHINHFSKTSIQKALNKANLSIVKFDKTVFRGAIACIAKRYKKSQTDCQNDDECFADRVNDIFRFWQNFDAHLNKVSQIYNSTPTAIFGAGVYGSYIASKIKDRVLLKCFLDNSPHLQNSTHMGIPVITPCDIHADIRVIYSGLNPSIARSVLEPLKTDIISKIVYFDEGDFKND